MRRVEVPMPFEASLSFAVESGVVPIGRVIVGSRPKAVENAFRCDARSPSEPCKEREDREEG